MPGAAELRIEVEGVGVGRERIFSVSKSTLQQELWAMLGGFGIGIVLGLFGLPITFFGILGHRHHPEVEVNPRAPTDG